MDSTQKTYRIREVYQRPYGCARACIRNLISACNYLRLFYILDMSLYLKDVKNLSYFEKGTVVKHSISYVNLMCFKLLAVVIRYLKDRLSKI